MCGEVGYYHPFIRICYQKCLPNLVFWFIYSFRLPYFVAIFPLRWCSTSQCPERRKWFVAQFLITTNSYLSDFIFSLVSFDECVCFIGVVCCCCGCFAHMCTFFCYTMIWLLLLLVSNFITMKWIEMKIYSIGIGGTRAASIQHSFFPFIAPISLLIYYYFCSSNSSQRHVAHERKISVHLRCHLKTMLMVIAFVWSTFLHFTHMNSAFPFGMNPARCENAVVSFFWKMECYFLLSPLTYLWIHETMNTISARYHFQMFSFGYLVRSTPIHCVMKRKQS